MERVLEAELDDISIGRSISSPISGSDKREDSDEEDDDQEILPDQVAFTPVEITDIPDQYEVRWCVSSNP